jgi:hypothetical protein
MEAEYQIAAQVPTNVGKGKEKRCGLFGQLEGGGVKVSLLQITFSGHSNFGTD